MLKGVYLYHKYLQCHWNKNSKKQTKPFEHLYKLILKIVKCFQVEIFSDQSQMIRLISRLINDPIENS